MPSTLGTTALRTVERVWETRMGAREGSLGSSAVSFVEWPGFSAAVVLSLGDALLVAGPGEAIKQLRDLPRQKLLDVASLEGALKALSPDLVGKALLAYTDESPSTPAGTSNNVHEVTRVEVEEVLSYCETDECDESGLLEMNRWFVADDDGVPVAAAGYEEWSNGVAHLGVAVSRAHRGRDLGRSVASAAISHALREHSVAQWRSRDTNTSSTLLGERLGFVQVGAQIAFDLRASEPAYAAPAR